MSTAEVINFPDDKPSAAIVYVTPEIAERWLAKNRRNRNLKFGQIEKFARDMAEGRWQITGEAIKFARNGDLLDGQNRLNAVIESGATVPLFVVRGLDSSAQEVMDSGARRSSADALHLRGHTSTKAIASAVNTWYSWTSGHYSHCMTATTGAGRLSNAEVVEIVESNTDIVESAHFAVSFRRSLRLPVGAIATAHRAMVDIDPDDAAEFFSRITELRTSGQGDPVHTLIKRTAEFADQSGRGLWPSTALYLLFRSWNAYRSNERLSKFQLGSPARGWVRIPEPI